MQGLRAPRLGEADRRGEAKEADCVKHFWVIGNKILFHELDNAQPWKVLEEIPYVIFLNLLLKKYEKIYIGCLRQFVFIGCANDNDKNDAKILIPLSFIIGS